VALSKFTYDDDGNTRWLNNDKCLASLMIVFGIEEIGQFLSAVNSSRGIAAWYDSVWNKMDIAVLASYLAFVLCRENGKPIWARIFISMNALPAMFRLLQITAISGECRQCSRSIHCLTCSDLFVPLSPLGSHPLELMGPLIVIIGGMLKDVSQFALLIIVAMLGFGVAIEGLTHPIGFDGMQNPMSLVGPWTWRLFGELFLDDVNCGNTNEFGWQDPGKPVFSASEFGSVHQLAEKSKEAYEIWWQSNRERNNDEPGPLNCAALGGNAAPDFDMVLARNIAKVLLFCYMLFTNILLVNLLVAQMTITFEKIKDKSYQTWKMQQYQLVRDFKNDYPPPSVSTSEGKLLSYGFTAQSRWPLLVAGRVV
jgi:hypothetical protein